ncbi:MAG: N5-glutamine S-adenosyl-L-methionine-dependent methyltransferase [Erysipelotrichaceae bacterium]|nr:MAG: N5-glutamine S-adenosyl-L-methionine-dependent [Erysipelotrichaceae bacterium]TXT19986.1 MAG: N5-glutamine S-adenosyl-L-methionine-dependent methyltransferase [Erysipelotrichaceae bacterium]
MISQLLRQAEKRLSAADIPNSYAKYVLNELMLSQNRNLYLEMDRELDIETQTTFDHMMDRLVNDEPLAYVLGYQVFLNYQIEVNPSVLIPRPETEELVMQVLLELDLDYEDHPQPTLIDIGCGSGAIAIALKKEMPKLKVMASDISEVALMQAKHNAKTLDADIEFFLGSLAEPLMYAHRKVDIIVCNPPYIPENESVQNSVVNYEPHVALFGGNDGLKFYREVLVQAPQVLNHPGMIAFEIGWNQRETLTELAKAILNDPVVNCYQDIQGKDRILIIKVK